MGALTPQPREEHDHDLDQRASVLSGQVLPFGDLEPLAQTQLMDASRDLLRVRGFCVQRVVVVEVSEVAHDTSGGGGNACTADVIIWSVITDSSPPGSGFCEASADAYAWLMDGSAAMSQRLTSQAFSGLGTSSDA